MTDPMPSTWRRLPLAVTEYEWYRVLPEMLPRKYISFDVLIHHRRSGDMVIQHVLTPIGGSPTTGRADIVRWVPQALNAGERTVSLDGLLRRVYLPAIFTAFGFDQRAVGVALCGVLPLPLHNDARRIVRHFLREKRTMERTLRDRAAARKKPWLFREMAKEIGTAFSRALYKLADAADTALW